MKRLPVTQHFGRVRPAVRGVLDLPARIATRRPHADANAECYGPRVCQPRRIRHRATHILPIATPAVPPRLVLQTVPNGHQRASPAVVVFFRRPRDRFGRRPHRLAIAASATAIFAAAKDGF